MDFSKSEAESLLRCEIAVVERENRALREDNANKARRIVDLEFKLSRLLDDMSLKP